VALAFTAIPRAPRPAADAGDVMRFELTVPEGFMRIATRAATMSVSDDGRRLAFMAVNSTNRPALFVREMSSVVPKVIQLSPSALAWPSWSPDGRYIVVSVLGAFGGPEPDIGQAGVIRRIDPAGGPATTLAESGRYPIWGSAGTIVYAGSDGRVFRVRENGGPSTAVTELDAEAGEVVHAPSSFLPDGRRFIFMAQNLDADKSTMFVASIDGGPRSKLDVPAARVLYAAGFLWYIVDGTLMAQRIDAAAARPDGGPTSIAEGVANFAVSPSGALVIVPRDSGSVKMAWLDSEGVAGPPVAEAGNYTGRTKPNLSPNGTRMVFVRPDANGIPDIWQVDLERNVSTRVTATPSIEDAAVYSPDGKHIVFSSSRAGNSDLYRRAADGSGSDELLFASPIRKTPSAISPDGTVLLFGQSGVTTGPDIWAMPLTGDRTPRPLVITSASEGNGQFSPDGRWIAYCAGESGDADQVFVEPYPPTGARTRLSTTQGSSPRWSTGGREIYYGTPTGQIMRVAVTMSGGSVRAGVPEAVLTAPELFSHNGFVLDARSRILALSPDTNRRREPATVILNWRSLVAQK
jgi:eukaryotic-like serine/threonine-protein kinase